MGDNRLYLDYISGQVAAAQFYTHAPLHFGAALEGRRGHAYPRQEIVSCLGQYNARLGAHARALQNIDALADPATFCVVAGQQAGFLGGPAYTAYKIVTAIRLASHLQGRLPGYFVPVFWLASEDHDFQEINHAYLIQGDGEVGQVKFDWEQEGNPISDLPIGDDVRRAYDAYFENLVPGPYLAPTRDLFAFQAGEDFTTWQARTWAQIFSGWGLVIVEPKLLSAPARSLLQFALQHQDAISHLMRDTARCLSAAGYTPALDAEQAGRLFTFDPAGRRVRLEFAVPPEFVVSDLAAHPERYSTDAALRPLLADAMLPTVVSVLGPGEVAYQAMLKPMYDLFDLPQPLLFPRKSYTVVSGAEADALRRYRLPEAGAEQILAGQLDVDAAFQSLVPASEQGLFAQAARQIEDALAPLRTYLESIDPSLERTWSQTVYNALRSLERLQERAAKARMSQLGFSKQELRSLQNALLPRGRLQERVFPLPHFLNRHGLDFIDMLLEAGALDDFAHHLLTVEGDGG